MFAVGLSINVLLGAMTYEAFWKHYTEAESFFAKGEYRKALNLYKKIKKDAFRYGFGYEVLYRIDECYYNMGDFDRAVKELEKLAKDKHVQGTYLEQEVIYALALAHAIQGDVNQAKQLVQQLQQYPFYKNSPRTKFLLGVIDYREGKYDEAMVKLEKADIPEAKFYYARTLAINRKPLDAIEVYKQLLAEYAGTPLEGLIQYGIIEANYLYGDYKGTSTLAEDFIKRYHGHPLSDYVQYYWAIAQYRLGHYDQALEKMSFLAKKKNFEFQGIAAYYAGNCEMQFKQYDRAIRFYQNARSLAGDNIVANLAFLRMAESYFYKGDSGQAYLMADQLLQFPLAPEEGGLGEYMRGAISYALGKYAEAVPSFQDVIENYPKSYFRRPAMAMTLLSLVRGRAFEEALLKGNLYWPEVSQDTSPDLWDGWFVYGLAEGLYYSEAYGEAELKYNWNIQRSIHRDLILLSRLGLGWCFLHEGRYDDALAQFNSIVSAATDTSMLIAIHMGIGVAQFNKGNHMDAYKEFAGLAASFPDRPEMPDVKYYQGYSAMAMRYYGDAISNWEEVVTKYPDSERAGEAAFRAAEIYNKAGEFQKAINLFKWLLEHFPDHKRAPRAQYMLAEAYTGLKDFETALKEYDRYLSLYEGRDPTIDEQVKERMQQIYAYLITQEGRDDLMEEFKTKFPDSDIAAATMYQQAAKLYEDKKIAEAAEMFFKMANEFPKSEYTADALFYAGTLFYQEKKFSEAATALQKYRDFYPDGDKIKDVVYYLGLAYFGLKDHGKAIEAFEDYLNRWPTANNPDDQRRLADVKKFLGFSYAQTGETPKAVKILQQAADLYEAIGAADQAAQLREYIKTLPH